MSAKSKKREGQPLPKVQRWAGGCDRGMEEAPLVALALALCFASLRLAQATEELPVCRILSSAKSANCRGQNLLRVPPHLPDTLESLDLSYNKIQRIVPEDFATLTRLKGLDLGYNRIASIADEAFASNQLLEQLSLFNNSLPEIPSRALTPLKNLRLLSMSNNLYPSAALDEAFLRLEMLRDLSLGGPAILAVGSRDFLPLVAIPLQRFALKTASGLMEYQAGAFAGLNARALWCDMALDKRPQALPAMLRDLWGKPLRYLRFRNLFEFTYYAGSLDLFANLPQVEAEELVFYRGKFNENLLRLVLLNVQKSRIQDLSFVAIDFARSPQWKPPEASIANLTLRRLVLKDISNPDVLRFDWTFTWFAGVADLSILNVNFNYVPCDAWDQLRSVVSLDVSNNRLLDGYIYNQGCSYQGTMPKLETFNLSHNALTRLGTVSSLASSWARLSVLDLSHNQIGGSPGPRCSWGPALVWLSLAYNPEVTAEAFGCLPATLRFLDLSHSRLERLELSYFEAAVGLQELRLSGNKIKYIPAEWKGPSLRVLALDGNSFGVIGKGSFANMPRLAQLKAGNNPYHCVCDLYAFLQETRREGRLALLDWPQGWTCYHPERLLDTSVAAYAPSLGECDIAVVLAIAVSVTAAVVTACMLLCWRFDVPWYLRATFHVVRSKARAGHSPASRAFAYHAFISYSYSDADWVRKELLGKLESASPPYRICIHERDFTPGRWIIDNIIDNMEKSRKVVFVLSRSFVDSEWCNYELYFAHHRRAVGPRFEDVVLVVKEAVDPQALPHKFCKLRKMLSTKTYLEWPSEPSRQAFFWAQLTSVLGKVEKAPMDPKTDPIHADQAPDGAMGAHLEMAHIAEGNMAADYPGSLARTSC